MCSIFKKFIWFLWGYSRLVEFVITIKFAQYKITTPVENATLWNYMKRVFLYLSCKSKEFSQSHLYTVISLYNVLQFVPLVPLSFHLNYVILLYNAPIICKLWTLFKYNQGNREDPKIELKEIDFLPYLNIHLR